VSQLNKDRVYQTKLEEIKQFRFDENVATVFDDMVSRSVPRYSEIQAATVKLAYKICPTRGRVVDLGCSTGTTLFAIAKVCPELELIGIDNSPSMLEQASLKAKSLGLEDRVKFVCQDISEYDYQNVDLFIAHYTLQFFPPAGRGEILEKMYQALNPGGAVIVSEKLKHQGKKSEDILHGLYHDFKAENGYSRLEISQKREALEGVLVPLTLEENFTLLRQAGFDEIEIYLKWINFATVLGLKQ
jgi:tRNA (cmo5U34)-methyltransferase